MNAEPPTSDAVASNDDVASPEPTVDASPSTASDLDASPLAVSDPDASSAGDPDLDAPSLTAVDPDAPGASSSMTSEGPPTQVLSRDDIRQLDLEQFQGPLDLLLALVRRRQLEVFAIPIATITGDYLHCLEVMEGSLSLEISGDFLTMASALVLLKSQRLLPREAEGEASAAVVHSEEELLRRLAALEQFQEVAEALWSGPMLGRDTFTRPEKLMIPTGRRPLAEPASTLTEAFRELILARAPRLFKEAIERGLSVGNAVRRILSRVARLLEIDGQVEFPSLLKPHEGRVDAVVLFSAVLELAKLRHVQADQPDPHAPLVLSPGERSADTERAAALLEMFDAQQA